MTTALLDAPASTSSYPSLHDVWQTAARLAGRVLETPVWRWQTGVVREQLAPATEVWLKLELFQRTGSFKLRGALNVLASLEPDALKRGVVAASAGNHAMTVAYAARSVGRTQWCACRAMPARRASRRAGPTARR